MITGGLKVDPGNTAQADAWDGSEGEYWATHAERFDASLARYQAAFHAAAAIRATDRVLDVGCGNGLTTREAARSASSSEALGVDLSSRMIEVARSIAEREGVANARFLCADAQAHPFAAARFDAVISRTGAMFFGRPEVAFGNFARAIRPGGRLTLLTWQSPAHNEWIGAFTRALAGREVPPSAADVPGPFSLSDPDRVRALLEGAGFSDVHLEGHAEPMHYGRDAADAHAFVLGLLGWMLEGKADADRARASDALLDTMRSYEQENGVELPSAAWLVTARRE